MRRRLPQGNSVILAVLRSPAHRLLSGLVVELRYTGRRTGREYAVPVQYARAADRLVVFPQDAPHKTWWRNFRAPQPVTVRLARRLHSGTARVVDRDDPGWEEAFRVYAARWRRQAPRLTGPFVEIALGPEPDPER